MMIDDRIAQLLCSRLCHDLVGPIGAINAGMELIDEMDGGGAPDESALGLMRDSAGEVTRRINFYRVAFGAGGGKASSTGTLSLNEARELAMGLYAGANVGLSWPEGSHEPPAFYSRPGKVLLLMVLLALEALPRGGTVTVHTAVLPEGAGVAVTAAGRGAKLRPDILAVVDGSAAPEEISARNVHAFLMRHLAQAEASMVEVDVDAIDELRLMALFKEGVPET